MDLKKWVWKLQRRHCGWEERINHEEVYEKAGNYEREKNTRKKVF